MTQTTHLKLPFIDAAQAQKHVTHNEALTLIDALAQLSVSARNVTTPPVSPSEGARMLVDVGASGAFDGKTGQVATFVDGGWVFLAPQAGWRLYVEAEDALIYYDGAAWRDLGLTLDALQNLSLFGLGTTADANNPLSAKINSALFTAKTAAEGGNGDLRFTLNKELAADTVSQLYQTGFSGRAETGLTGDDDFHVKVSPDGSTWKEAIVIDKTTGVVSLPFTSMGGGAVTSVAGRTGAVVLTAADIGGLAASATTDTTNAANISSGALGTARLPAYTGDVTKPAGSGATTIAAGAVTNAKMATMAAGTIKSNITGAAAAPSDNSISAVLDNLLGTAQGAVVYRGAGAWSALAPGAAGQRLRSGGAAANPSWANTETNVVTFSASGTYTPSPGVRLVDVILFGGGGGGGSGACQASGAAASGGGGGGGGGVNRGLFTAAQIGASQSVTIGAAGSGGTAQSTASTAGVGGSTGGSTQFGSLLYAGGGGGGAAGGLAVASGGGGGGAWTNAVSGSGATGGTGAFGGGAGGGGAAAAAVTSFGASGGGGAPASGAAGTTGGACLLGGSGGGGGGGLTTANATSAGGAGGTKVFNGAGLIATGGAAGAAGAAGSNLSATSSLDHAGNGGGGGGSSLTAAGAGGAGGFPGGGGGGGGASRNGGTSGGGGAGGVGYAMIIEYF